MREYKQRGTSASGMISQESHTHNRRTNVIVAALVDTIARWVTVGIDIVFKRVEIDGPLATHSSGTDTSEINRVRGHLYESLSEPIISFIRRDKTYTYLRLFLNSMKKPMVRVS